MSAQDLEPKGIRAHTVTFEQRKAFEGACRDLVSGNLSAARRAASALPATDAATTVLEALIEERDHNPKAPWVDLLERAWRKVGSPSLEGAGLLPRREQLVAPTEAQLRALSQGSFVARVAGAYLTGNLGERSKATLPPDLVDAALATLARSAPLPEQVLAILVLEAPGVPEARRAAIAGAVSGAIDRLAQEHPESIHFGLWASAATMQADRLIDRAELSALEQLVQKPRYDSRMPVVYAAVRDALSALPGATAKKAAFDLAILTRPQAPLARLSHRAELTFTKGDPGLASRLAVALGALGDRLLREPSLVDQTVGANLLALAAPHASDPGLIWRAQTEVARTQELRRASQERTAGLALTRWPLSPLLERYLEEAATDEVKMLERLARRE